jgi:hypothetical protein
METKMFHLIFILQKLEKSVKYCCFKVYLCSFDREKEYLNQANKIVCHQLFGPIGKCFPWRMPFGMAKGRLGRIRQPWYAMLVVCDRLPHAPYTRPKIQPQGFRILFKTR